jgi:hypothetical protein
MTNYDLEYNSSRENLAIPEYGRNVQKLVNYGKTIKDKEKRQHFIEAIIDLMNIMVPSNKSLADNKQKMWNHVFKIANYELEVEVPEGVEIHMNKGEKPKHDLEYPSATYKFRHYGSYVQKMVAKARSINDEEKKEHYGKVIASYMKLAYQTWNREHYVNDKVILQDLKEISSDEIVFDEEYSIDNLVSLKQIKHNANKWKKRNYSKNKSSKNKKRK